MRSRRRPGTTDVLTASAAKLYNSQSLWVDRVQRLTERRSASASSDNIGWPRAITPRELVARDAHPQKGMVRPIPQSDPPPSGHSIAAACTCGPLPHHGPYEQGIDKVRAGGAASRQGRAPVLTRTRGAAQTPGPPDRRGGPAAARPPALQPAHGAQLPVARAVPVLLDLHVGHLGGEVPDRWCTQALRSRIEPMRQVARMLRRHRPLLLNIPRQTGRRPRPSRASTTRHASPPNCDGFRTYRVMEIAHPAGPPENSFPDGGCFGAFCGFPGSPAASWKRARNPRKP